MISQTVRIPGNIIGLALIAILISACSSQETKRVDSQSSHGSNRVTPRQHPPTRRLSAGERAAVVAVRQVGIPYRYGGSNTDGFDCSGLVHYAYSSVGKSVPRTTRHQWHEFLPVTADELRIGDVLFFDIEGKISHVGLYLGSRRFVHAPSTGREVSVDNLDSSYYRRTFVRGGRPR